MLVGSRPRSLTPDALSVSIRPPLIHARVLSGTRYGVRRVIAGEDERSGRVRPHGEHERRLPRNGRLGGVGSVLTVTVADGGNRLAHGRFQIVWH
jgi:hypothetical protein